MSFDNPSSFAHWQSSLASSSDKQNTQRQNKPPQSPWAIPTAPTGSRRELTPLATSGLSNPSGGGTRRQTQPGDSEVQNSAVSPLGSAFPPLSAAAAATRFGSRRSTPPGSSHSNSPITIIQAGAHQQQNYHPGRSVTSPRSRTNTPSQQFPGFAGSNIHSGLGAGGGGGHSAGTRSGTYSPSPIGPGVGSPTGFNFERSSSISSNVSSATGQSSLSKISATQVLLLVDTISEKEGKAKWESKAEKIRKVWNLWYQI